MDTTSTSNNTFSPGKAYQLFLGGEKVEGKTYVDIHFPYDRAVLVGRVAWAERQDVDNALTMAQEGAQTMAAMPLHRRASILHRVADLIAARAAIFAELIVYEVSKPIKDARLEIDRAIAAVHLAAEEATRISSEVIPMDAVPGGEGRIAYTVRRPPGIIVGITGFNFPLLLDCHKIAPALAAGNAIILKPAPETPITALELAAVCAEAGVPHGALSILPAGDDIGEMLVRDERVAMITFTGMATLRDAREQGAQLLVGGELLPDGCITPAVLLGVTPSMQICHSELFGPAVAIAPYDTLDEAIALANSTPYGLQAGIFTNNLQAALYAAQRLDFGGVHINEVSSYRADHMPYGGIKASGMGREGPRYAIEEMSETKIIIITL